jgi:hypothetical protein
MRYVWIGLVLLTLTSCTHYPPPLSPTKGQTAAQQEADAKDCDHQVHSAASQWVTGMFTAWSEKERDAYVACMQGRGYTVSK